MKKDEPRETQQGVTQEVTRGYALLPACRRTKQQRPPTDYLPGVPAGAGAPGPAAGPGGLPLPQPGVVQTVTSWM